MRYPEIRDPAAERQAHDTARATRFDQATSEAVTEGTAAIGAETQRVRAVQKSLGLALFADSPQVAPLFKVRRMLTAGLERTEAEADLIAIDHFLKNFAGRQPETAKSFKERRTRRVAQLKVGVADPPAPQPEALPPEVTRALEAVAARAVEKPPSPEGRLVELENMRAVIQAGLDAVHILIEQLRDDAKLEAAKNVAKRHGEALLKLFRACQALTEAAAEERAIRDAVSDATGGPARSDVLPGPGQILSAILLLGSETDWNSSISQYRRSLQSSGLLK
jgi:hypothetical protein